MAIEFSSPMYGAYNQTRSKPPVNPALHGQGSDPMSMFMEMMKAFFAQQQGGAAPNHVADIRELRNDPQGDMNKLYIPGQNNAANPFFNGTLPSSDALAARAAGNTNPAPPMSPPSHAMPNRTAPMAPPPFPNTDATRRPLPGGGFEQMIDPSLPDAMKYGDQNFWSALMPSKKGWKPGQTVR